MSHRTIVGLVLVAVGLAPTAAQAGNGIKPRTPVLWEDVPCMIVVDRSADPMLHLPYGVPYDDPGIGEELGPDEVADSRTHQFFAFSRDIDLWSYLPRWITGTDILAYDTVAPPSEMGEDTFDPMDIDPEDVFETSTVWEGAWFRINADDDRRPISIAQAAMGVDWDTSMVPAGTYHLQGYTWEPPLNIWSRRPGVVKVTDGGDPAQYGPAAALHMAEADDLIYHKGDTAILTGCLDAMDGTTVSAAWANSDPDLGMEWTPIAEDLELPTGPFEIDFAIPDEAAGFQIMLRVVATDPMDRTYTGYLGTLVTVLLDETPNCPDAGSSFIGGPGCNDSDDAGEADGTSGGGTGSGGTVGTTGTGETGTTAPGTGDDGDPRKGCGCTGNRRPGAAMMVLPIAALAARRRRR
jgi:uncharacterized protein (TIGR03382 family)